MRDQVSTHPVSNGPHQWRGVLGVAQMRPLLNGPHPKRGPIELAQERPLLNGPHQKRDPMELGILAFPLAVARRSAGVETCLVRDQPPRTQFRTGPTSEEAFQKWPK